MILMRLMEEEETKNFYNSSYKNLLKLHLQNIQIHFIYKKKKKKIATHCDFF
jgi:hypothetical protein